MQLESLKMFCDVVETGSFSRAAQLNHVTQSAVSQQIRALENRYDQKLLSRSARQVTPTPAGERLFRGCKEILARFGEVEQEIREQSAEVAGTCTVSTIYSVGLHELQNIQKELLKTHPKVNMRLIYRRSDQVYDDVILGAAEIGVVAYPQPRAGVDVIPFRDDKLVVVLRAQPPARREGEDLDHRARRHPVHRLRSRGAHPQGARSGLPREGRGARAGDGDGQRRDHQARGGDGRGRLDPPAPPPWSTSSPRGRSWRSPFAEGNVTRPIGLLVRKGKYLDRASQAVLDAFKAAASSED